MLKGAAGVLGLGATATGGALLYKGLSKPQTYSIKFLLASKNTNKRLLVKSNDGSEAHWKAAWKAYLTSKNNIWNLKEWKDSPVQDENAPSSFMDACTSNSNGEVEDTASKEYINVLSFCTRNTLVKDLVLESNRVLNDDSNGGWSESWKSYRSSNQSKEKDDWQLTDWNDKKSSDDTISENLKTQCKDKLEVESGFKAVKDYQDVVNWCSKAK
ncbi:hypothetical protein HF1_02570 [Mycoplasma haemofelis str. Langford 1]|uniref:Uncharacterized protein n=1 Tax=Mycoplasma haemofelis (strain Langford 1) TaxID=941640 RepID=E8ZKU9_MYCHL|nr:hypothetical protein [Mycoplasma haemofelis]CBY92265.1 hypothetical protein HF1_02570 [Mycoplasma haemofelis str. Langford 1]